MRHFQWIAAVAILGACTGAPPPAQPPEPDSCGASGLQHLIASPVPQPFPAQGPVRVFDTGEPVTMDYLAERINVELDPATRLIVSVQCG